MTPPLMLLRKKITSLYRRAIHLCLAGLGYAGLTLTGLIVSGLTLSSLILAGFSTASLFAAQPAHAQGTAPAQPDIRAVIMQDLFKAARFYGRYMRRDEFETVKKVQLYVSDRLPIEDVSAGIAKKTKERQVSFSVKAVDIYANIARAVTLAKAQDLDEKFLFGYLKYLSLNSVFENVKSPTQFAAFYGDPKLPRLAPAQQRQLSLVLAQVHSQMMGFLLLHEYAHHVLGHVDNPKVSNKERRQRERDADEWAVNIMLKAGNVPTGVVYLMLYFNEKDGRSLEKGKISKHPAGIDRTIALLDKILDALPTMRSRLKRQNAAAGMAYNHDFIMTLFTNFKDMVEAKRAKQDRLDKNPQAWLALAEKGDINAQLKVAQYYSKAEKGYPYDFVKAGKWYKRAVENPRKYAYAEAVEAEVAYGFFLAFHKKHIAHAGRNIPLARKYFKQALSKGYVPVKIDLKALDKLEKK